MLIRELINITKPDTYGARLCVACKNDCAGKKQS